MKTKKTLVDYFQESKRSELAPFDALSSLIGKMESDILKISEKEENNELNRIIEGYQNNFQVKVGDVEQENMELVPENKLISAEKIIEFLEEKMSEEDYQNDDKDVNEISSLSNQFSFISKSISSNLKNKFNKLGDFFTKIDEQLDFTTRNDLELFLKHVFRGDAINDHSLEVVKIF